MISQSEASFKCNSDRKAVFTLKVNWIGAYKLTESNIEKYAPKSAGVYRISVELTDDTLKVRYVGQTENLYHRMCQYFNKDTNNKCLINHLNNHVCYFRLATISHADDRDSAEKALFDHFKPECNDPDCIPNTDALDINFD